MTSSPNDHALTPLSVEHGYVQLPYTEDQFKDFLKSLLGSPQSLTHHLSGGAFEITQSHVRNLHELLCQRIAQQNGGVLANFSARIVYSDDSSAELGSIDEVTTYNELRDVTAVAIHLAWDFVIRFPERESPEKQKVQVSFLSRGHLVFDDSSVPFLYQNNAGFSGFITARVEHTARTWGADMQALLKNHLEGLFQQPSPIRRFLRQHVTALLTLPSMALFMLLSVAGSLYAASRFASNHEPLDSDSTIAILQHIDLAVSSGEWSRFYLGVFLFLLVAFVISAFFAVAMESAFVRSSPSFILFTAKDREAKQRVLKRQRRHWRRFTAATIGNVLVALLANWIFVNYFQ